MRTIVDQSSPIVVKEHDWITADRMAWMAVIVAFAIRVSLAVYVGLNNPPQSGSDSQEYDTYAWNLAQGRGYRGMSADVSDRDHLTAFRPPGPSLLFAGVYLVAGHRYDAVRIVNCGLASLSVYVIFRLGRRVFPASAALLAAITYAVYPLAVYQSIDILSEPLGVLLFLLFLDACIAFGFKPTWRTASLAGACLGLSLLTRSNYVIMIPLLGLWSLWQFRSSWSALFQFAAVFVIAAAFVAPWAVRNYFVFEKFIPLSTLGGSALLQGNNRVVATDPKLVGYCVWDTDIPEYREALRAAGDEWARDQLAKQFAIRWLKENPDKLPWLLWNKFARSWTPFLHHNPSRTHWTIYLLTWGPILALFCVGFFTTLGQMLRHNNPGWLLHLAVLHYVINSLVFFAYIRYRAPIDPICILFASVAATNIWTWWCNKSRGPAGAMTPNAESGGCRSPRPA